MASLVTTTVAGTLTATSTTQPVVKAAYNANHYLGIGHHYIDLNYTTYTNDLELRTGGTPRLTINRSTGAATFTGTVTAAGALTCGSGFSYSDTTRLLTITNSGNAGGINLATANVRIYFGGTRAIEGTPASASGNLTLGEGYSSGKVRLIAGSTEVTGIFKYTNSAASNNTGDLKIIPSASASGGVGYATQIIGVNIADALSNNLPKQANTWGGVTGSAAIAINADDNTYGQFMVLTAPQNSSANTELTPRFWISGAGAATFSAGLTVGGGISADTDDSYNLGSDSYRFKNLYLRSDCIIGTDATVGGSLDVTGGLVVDGASTLGDGSDTTHVKGSLVVDTNIYGPSLGAVAVAAGLNVTGAGSFTGALTIGAYTLPNTDGTSGYHLQTNGSGAVTWQPGGAGTVTSVTAGTGMTQTGTSTVNPTLNVIGGTGITANANDIAITNTAVTAGSYTYAAITVDAQGRLTAASSGTAPGGGTVTGSGTDNYIPRWNGTTALHNSIMYDSGASVGISSVAFTSPAGTLHTQAGGSNITYLDAYSTTNGTGSLLNFRKSDSATIGTKTQTDSGDSLGTMGFYGVHTSSDWGLGASINVSQEGVSGTAYVPAHIAFATCTSSAYAEHMRIASDGNVGIGTNNPANDLQVGSVGASNFSGNHFAFGNGTKACAFFQSNTFSNIYTTIAYKFWVSGTTALTIDSSRDATFTGDFTNVENLYVNQEAAFDGHAYPYADSSYTLGTNALRWSTIYGDAGNFSGVVTGLSLATSAATGVVATAAGGGWNAAFHSINTNADSAPSYITLEKISASPANGDYIGGIVMKGRTSTGVQRNYVEQWGRATVVTNGSESSRWNCGTYGAGTEYPNTLVCDAGNVGIGTATPSSILQIQTADGSYGLIHKNASAVEVATYSGGSSGAIGTKSSHRLDLLTGGGTRIAILPSGYVGIGTTAPLQKLTIVGRANSDQAADYYGAWFDGNTASGGYSFFAVGAWYSSSCYFQRKTGQNYTHIYEHNSGHNIVLQAGSGSHGEVSGAGNVGIGTNDPGGKLEVDGSSKTVPLLIKAGTGANSIKFIGRSSDNNSSLEFFQNNGSSGGAYFQCNGTWMRARADGGVHFRNGNTPVTTSSDFTINGMSLGIGTTAPNRTLSIYNNSLACLQLCNSTTGAAAGDGFQMQLSGSTGYIFNYEAGDIIFGTSAATRLTLKAAGQAIFTGDLTCSDDLYLNSANAWIISGSAGSLLTGGTLRIQSFAKLRVDGGLKIGEIANGNTRYTTSSWCNYLELDAASSGGGGIIWSKQSTSKQSGILSNHGKLEIGYSTATDNSAAWVPALTVNDVGNVGIGTTAPGHPLVVVTPTGDKGISLTNSSNVELIHMRQEAGDSGAIGLKDGGNVQVWLTSRPSSNSYFNVSGANFGIGTDTPLTKTHIDSAGSVIVGGNAIKSSTMKGLSITNSTNDTSSVGVWFGTGGSHWSGISGQRLSTSTWGTDLRFYTHEDTAQNLTYTSERMRITSAGNVGINTTDPKYSLQVNGDIALGPQGASTTKTICSARSDGGSTNRAAIRFVTNSNNDESISFDVLDSGVAGYPDALKIDYTGNVGIGTTEPSVPLEVVGADSGITISSASASRPHLRLVNGTTNMLQLSANGAYGAIGDGTDANRYMSFKGGSVGIGTTTPATKLEVKSGDVRLTDAHVIEWGGTKARIGGSNTGDYLRFYTDDTTRLEITSAGAATFSGALTGTSATFSGDVVSGSVTIASGSSDTIYANRGVFGLRGNTSVNLMPAGSTQLTCAAATTTIHNALTGTTAAFTATGAADVDILTLDNNRNTVSDQWGIKFQDSFRTRARIQAVNLNAGNAGAALAFEVGYSTDTVERMRINNFGNVGIGTDAPAGQLHVYDDYAGERNLYFDNHNASGVMQLNIRAGTGDEYLSLSRSTTQASILVATDPFYIRHHHGGAWHYSITVDGAGEVGINRSDPSYNLDVNGTGRFTGALTASTVTASDGGGFTGSGASLTDLNGTNISSGEVAAARLGSGSSITTKFLRGDNTWQTVTSGGGSVTSVAVTVGTGLDVSGSPITSSGTIDIDLDLSEFTDMTADITTSDEVILLDSGAERRKAFGELKLSKFNNDSGWTSNTGDITAVTAGTALSGGGTSGGVTLNVANPFLLGDNTDTWGIIGRAKVGYIGHGDYAGFAHRDVGTTTSYALIQDSVGSTFLNAANGKIISFRINNANVIAMDSTSLYSVTNNAEALGKTGNRWSNVYSVLGNFSGTVTGGTFSGSGASLTNLSATQLTSGTVNVNRLGSSGTRSSSTFLRGDNTWATPSGGGGGDTVSITASADDILSVSSGAISGVDAGSSDKIVFWDNSQNKLTYLAASTGLYTSGTNLKVTSAVLMKIQDPNYNYCTPASNEVGFYQGGSITVVASGSGVTFSDSTSSDYRLKSNISAFNSEAWTKVKSVNLRRFDFDEGLLNPKLSTITNKVGFIAHELAEAGIEGAVEGTKDEVDSDGNPVYQKVCHAKLVPVMWGALKEAIARIETLETKVQTLENS